MIGGIFSFLKHTCMQHSHWTQRIRSHIVVSEDGNAMKRKAKFIYIVRFDWAAGAWVTKALTEKLSRFTSLNSLEHLFLLFIQFYYVAWRLFSHFVIHHIWMRSPATQWNLDKFTIIICQCDKNLHSTSLWVIVIGMWATTEELGAHHCRQNGWNQ